MEQHCKADQCKLYYTKPGTTPVEYAGLLETVFVCRARQKAGLSFANYPLPFWAEKAYITGNGVFTQVENEWDDSEDDTPKAKITSAGDSGAFKLIYEHLQEQGRTEVPEEDDWIIRPQ